MKHLNRFGSWAHSDAFIHFVVILAAVYCALAVGVMVAA